MTTSRFRSGGYAAGKNFGSTRKVLIGGNVFDDLDGNRSKNAGEGGLSGWRVFIDASADGIWQSGEKSVTSDASGNWSFKDLAAGTYRVRVVTQATWKLTSPTSGYPNVTLGAGGIASGKLFGAKKA